MSAEVPKLHDRTVGRVGNLSRVVLPLAVAIGFPAYLLSTNRLIPFANDFHCDPWDYFGMFYLAGQTSMLNPLSRVLSRVPEFLIGNISTALLPGIAADYGNFIVIYVGSVLALYFAVSRTFGPLPAMIAATFLGFNAILVGNLSTTLFSPSILYNVIAILFARRASDCRGLRRTLELIFCGIALGFSIHGHVYTVFCAFAIPLYALKTDDWRGPQLFIQLVGVGTAVALGFILATLILGGINDFIFGGRFLFFLDQFESISKINTVDYQIADWFVRACRGAIFVIAIALPVTQIAMLARKGAPDRVELRIWQVNLVTLIIAAALILDDRLGGFFMQYDYYYVLLLPHIAVSLAALYAEKPSSMASFAFLVGAYVFISALAVLPTIEQIAEVFASPDNGFFSLGIVGLITSVIATAAFVHKPWPSGLALAVALILVGCLGFAMRPQRMGRLVWQQGTRDTATYGADNYVRIRKAMQFLAAHRFPSRPTFWVSIDDGYWETIAPARSYNYCLVEMHLPRLDTRSAEFRRDFHSGHEIVLIQREAQVVDLANAALQPLGLRVVEEDRRQVAYAGVSYFVVIGKLEAWHGT